MITVFLEYDRNDLRPHEVEEATEHLYVDSLNWRRDGVVPTNRAFSRLDSDPLPELPPEHPRYVRAPHPKHAYAEQVAEEESFS